MVAKSNINGAKIPPGQLISFVQKGIMYQELERSVADDGSVAGSSEPFSLLRASDGTAGKASPSEGPPAKKHKSENDSSRGAGSSRGGASADDGSSSSGGGARGLHLCVEPVVSAARERVR